MGFIAERDNGNPAVTALVHAALSIAALLFWAGRDLIRAADVAKPRTVNQVNAAFSTFHLTFHLPFDTIEGQISPVW